jgi:hypothetical protein
MQKRARNELKSPHEIAKKRTKLIKLKEHAKNVRIRKGKTKK